MSWYSSLVPMTLTNGWRKGKSANFTEFDRQHLLQSWYFEWSFRKLEGVYQQSCICGSVIPNAACRENTGMWRMSRTSTNCGIKPARPWTATSKPTALVNRKKKNRGFLKKLFLTSHVFLAAWYMVEWKHWHAWDLMFDGLHLLFTEAEGALCSP